MSETTGLEFLINAIEKIWLYLGRQAVQTQLLTIGITILVALTIDRIFRFGINRFIMPRLNKTTGIGRFMVILVSVAKELMLPLIGFGILNYAIVQFNPNPKIVGLIDMFRNFLWMFFVYRLAIALAYQFFDKNTVARYHYRLIGPFFAIFVVIQILSTVVDLQQLYYVKIFGPLSATQLTVGALFIATVGLYFWIDAVLGFEDLTMRSVRNYTSINPGTAAATLSIGRYFFIGLGVFIAVSLLGVDQTTVAAISGGLSVGVGFAMQAVLGNFISGILLMFEQSLRPGDVISVDGEMGRVKNLSIRATTVETIDNVEKIIPNETLLTSTVTTFTRSSHRVRIRIPLEVNEETATPEFANMVMALTQKHPQVLNNPGPRILMTGFGDTSVQYQVAVWIEDPMESERVSTDLNRMIWESYPEYGYGNSTPQRNINIIHVPWLEKAAGS